MRHLTEGRGNRPVKLSQKHACGPADSTNLTDAQSSASLLQGAHETMSAQSMFLSDLDQLLSAAQSGWRDGLKILEEIHWSTM